LIFCFYLYLSLQMLSSKCLRLMIWRKRRWTIFVKWLILSMQNTNNYIDEFSQDQSNLKHVTGIWNVNFYSFLYWLSYNVCFKWLAAWFSKRKVCCCLIIFVSYNYKLKYYTWCMCKSPIWSLKVFLEHQFDLEDINKDDFWDDINFVAKSSNIC